MNKISYHQYNTMKLRARGISTTPEVYWQKQCDKLRKEVDVLLEQLNHQHETLNIVTAQRDKLLNYYDHSRSNLAE